MTLFVLMDRQTRTKNGRGRSFTRQATRRPCEVILRLPPTLRTEVVFATFTVSGFSAPPYIAVSGLTEKKAVPNTFPDGILAVRVPGFCRGGDDLFNKSEDWLVFLRSDKKDTAQERENSPQSPVPSITNKKFIHYNDEVLTKLV